VLGAVFVLLTVLPAWKCTWKRKGFLLLLAVFICCPWFIRNYMIFDRFIFVKSNLFFEMYQNNLSDDDGLLDGKNLAQVHPYFNEQARHEYTTMGEVAFIAKYRRAFLASLMENPRDYFSKCANRVLHILLLYPDYSPRPKTAPLKANLKYYLKAGFYWIPFAFAIFLLLNPASRSEKTIHVGMVIFSVYLMPYVLVGYYNRYRIPLLPVFAVLYFYFLSSLIELWKNKRRSSPINDEEDDWLPE
jgi:hypothetical protein